MLSNLKKLLAIFSLIFFLSCAGSKVEIKPERVEIVEEQDVYYFQLKKIFPDEVPNFDVDNYVVPKRKKITDTVKIMPMLQPALVPVVVPITFQSPSIIDTEKTHRSNIPFINEDLQTKKVDSFSDEVKSKEPPNLESSEKNIKPMYKSDDIRDDKINLVLVDVATEEFYIQIGAFVSLDNALEMLKGFRRLYPDLKSNVFFDADNLYKVRVGGDRDLIKLRNLLTFIRKHYPDAFIVKGFSFR